MLKTKKKKKKQKKKRESERTEREMLGKRGRTDEGIKGNGRVREITDEKMG